MRAYGEEGIFTLPTSPVDRDTYPFIGPSAARGLLESVYWKPEMHWEVYEVWVLKPIQFFSMKGNELRTFGPEKRLATRTNPIDIHEHRTQRTSTYIYQPDYLIRAAIVCHNPTKEEQGKHWAIANRKLHKGARHGSPCFGRKHCLANVEPPSGNETPIDRTEDFGTMFFDWTYEDDNHGRPLWFRAQLDKGVLRIPTELYRHMTFGRRAA
jgi:CRISPR-associated protein Cas5d